MKEIVGNVPAILSLCADLMDYLSESDIGLTIFTIFLDIHPQHRETFDALVKIGEKNDSGFPTAGEAGDW